MLEWWRNQTSPCGSSPARLIHAATRRLSPPASPRTPPTATAADGVALVDGVDGTPQKSQPRTIAPTICTIVANRNPIIGVVGRGFVDQAKLAHPRAVGLMSELRAGCGVRREAASEGRPSLEASTLARRPASTKPGPRRSCDVTNPLRCLGEMLATFVGTALGGAFFLLGTARGRKALHRRGEVLEGMIGRRGAVGRTGVAWLDEAGTDHVAVRFSQSLGLPGPRQTSWVWHCGSPRSLASSVMCLWRRPEQDCSADSAVATRRYGDVAGDRSRNVRPCAFGRAGRRPPSD